MCYLLHYLRVCWSTMNALSTYVAVSPKPLHKYEYDILINQISGKCVDSSGKRIPSGNLVWWFVLVTEIIRKINVNAVRVWHNNKIHKRTRIQSNLNNWHWKLLYTVLGSYFPSSILVSKRTTMRVQGC